MDFLNHHGEDPVIDGLSRRGVLRLVLSEGAALAACYAQARRATKVDPLVVMRSD